MDRERGGGLALLVVGVLLVAAHVVATLLSYGPATLAVDPRLAALWLRRGLLALVPMPITYVAVRGLDADLAPPWLWSVAAIWDRRAARRDLPGDPGGGRVSEDETSMPSWCCSALRACHAAG